MAYDLKDYKEVSERIIDLRQKYPDASLQSEVILWPTEALPFIAVKALCYRTRKDENPGVGLAWEPFPGKTPYTRDSELQNAETSAWGRAIVAALASDTKQGVASADEVRNRRTRESGPQHDPPPASTPSQSVEAPLAGTKAGGPAGQEPSAERVAGSAGNNRVDETRSASEKPTPAASTSSSGDDTTNRGGASPEVTATGPNSDGEAGGGSVAAAIAVYGGRAHLLRAARLNWDVRSIDDIDADMAAELIRLRSNPAGVTA